MRITYGRPERMIRFQELLKKEQLEYFLPMRVDYQKTDDWNVRKSYVPAVNGLIFIHSTQEELTNLKMTRKGFEPMHYFMNHFAETEADRVLVIPDRQMAIFRMVASSGADGLEFFSDESIVNYKQGDKVRVKEGPLKGAEGYIKRIKKDRRLLVAIEGFVAVATSFIPPQFLEVIPQ